MIMVKYSAFASYLAITCSCEFGTAPVDALLTVGPPIVHRHQRLGWRSSSSSSLSPSSLSSSVINEIDSFYQTFPYASAFITCGIKASAADIVAQQKEVITQDGHDDYDDAFASAIPTDDGLPIIDAKRNFSFIMYGGLYQGIAQFVIFNQIFPQIFGDGTDIVTVASKVAFDNAFISPLICLPVAYLVKSVVFQFTLEEAWSRYVEDVKDGLIFKYWCFWVPAQSLTFSVIPPHLRIAFIAVVSFFWLVVFSTISSHATDAEAVIDRES